MMGPLNQAIIAAATAAGREAFDAIDRAEWLARRERDITASAAAGLLAASPYDTPYRLYMRKAKLAPPEEETSAMRRGTLLEPLHAQIIADEKPGWRAERGAIYIRDPAARIGATPDVFAMIDGRIVPIQLKSVSPEAFRKKWRIEGSYEHEPPAYVQIQAMVEAAMMGVDRAVVSAMVIGNGIDLHFFDIDVRPRILAALREATADFWTRIAEGRPYGPDYLADGEFILVNWREGAAPQIDLSDDARAVEIMAERARLKEIEKQAGDAERARRALDAEMVARLGNASAALIGDEVFSVRRQMRKPFVVAASEFTVCAVKKASGATKKEAA